MKFIVTRVSLYGDEEIKSCSNAIKEKIIYTDIRTVSKSEDVPAYKGRSDWWYKEGANHRLIDNNIARDLEKEEWFIEISSLEELMNFIEDVGKIIIRNHFKYTSFKEIKIYDDYIE